MKILVYFADDLNKPTGSRIRCINLANSLAKYHDVYLAAPSIMNINGVKYKFVKIGRKYGMGKFLKYFNFFNTLRVVREVKPDLIYSFLDVSLPSMLIPAKLFKIPHFVELHGLTVEEFSVKYNYYSKNGIIYIFLESIFKWMIRRTDYQLVGCLPLKNYYGGTLKNFTIMPPSINTNLFNSSVKPNKYIEKIKKNINKIVVTYAGNFSYYQGTDLLIEIIKKLKDRNIDDFIFVIIGTTNEAFNKKIEEYHLKSEVIFIGLVPNNKVSSYLRASDVLLIPRLNIKTTQYAFPLKPLEYLSVGRCVIATKGWPHDELVQHMKYGLLADPNPEDFVEKLLLAKNKNLR